LRGRITVTPEERNGLSGFRFRGEGTVQKLLSGWLADFPHKVASPAGFEPAFWP
jgi:hypothetical protein